MKKIIFFVILLCMVFGKYDYTQAQTVNTYLDNVTLNLGTQVLTGDFLFTQFMSDHGGNLINPGAYVDLFSSNNSSNSLIGTINLGTIPQNTNIFSFTFTASGLSPSVGHDRIRFVWPEVGVLNQSNPLFLDNIEIITGLLDSTSPITNPSLAEIDVEWDEPILENTEIDGSGIWYYKIASIGNVIKSTDSNAYLVMMKINNTDDVKLPIVLGHYPAGSGLTFSVTYPACTDLNCPQIINSAVEPGYRYEVFFSFSQNGSDLMHSLEDVLVLPEVPDLVNSGDGYITIETAEFIEDPDTNSMYISVMGNVLENVSGNYQISVIGRDSDGSRPQQNYYIGAIPGVAGMYTAPNASYVMDTSYDTYEVAVDYNNMTILTQSVNSLQNPVNNTSGGGSLFGGFSNQQQTILEEGIVPTDCGYGIGPDGSGRMCGFSDFIKLIQNVIEYIFILILPIAALMFAYAGFKLLTKGSSETERTAAKKMIFSVLTGIVVIMLAWLIVKTILVSLGASAGFTMFLDIG